MSLSKSSFDVAMASHKCAHYFHPGETCTQMLKKSTINVGKSATMLFVPIHLVGITGRK